MAKEIFTYLKKHGRFFSDKTKRVFLLYKNTLYEVSDNPQFHQLLLASGFDVVC